MLESTSCLRPSAIIALPCLALLLAGSTSRLTAQERFHRLLDSEDGLNPPSVTSVAQDTVGFLWIGTEGGLFRWDGVEMRRWSPAVLDRKVHAVRAAPTGPVIALREGGALFELTGDDARPVVGADGEPIEDARDATLDGEGELWVLRGGEVWRSDREVGWTRVTVPLVDGERLYLLRPDPGGRVFLLTTHGLWRVGDSGPPSRLVGYDPRDIPVDAVTAPDGSVLVLTFLGRLFRAGPEGAVEILRTDRIGAPGRAIALAERGGTLWLSLDRWLVGWRPAAPPVVLGQADGLYSGGPLLVDRENSLWMGSFVGLYQFPEPDTELWTERHGLPSNHVRYVARSGDAVWFTTWQGGGYLERDLRGGEVHLVDGLSPSRLCVDSRGDLWAGGRDGLLRARGGEIVDRHFDDLTSLYGCHEDARGVLRLATDRGLYAFDSASGGLWATETPFPGEAATVEAVLVDEERRLWVASEEAVCRAEGADSTGLTDGGSWACDTLEGAVHLSGGGLIETAGGAVWASSNRLGVLVRGAEGWKPLPGLERLPSRSILSLVPSPAGGVWLVGHGVLHRIVEIPTVSPGWRIEEQLSHWHGLPGPGGTHVLEEPDGSVWVTTSRGLARVPASSRFTALRAPRVVLVDARVDDEPVEFAGLDLAHDRNRLELRFAALSFRDPSRIRYQVRLGPEDPWITTAGQPSFRWVELPAGEYRAQVRSSLDGETWSDPSAIFAFAVAPPWYRTPWAVSLYVALLLLTLYAAHRLRTRHLLDLERQRTRIAMDLHDEIGSGLGSVGILSGILASHDVDAREARRMAGEIARTTGELGTALSQIVWALEPRDSTMQELAGRLAEMGRRLFADQGTEFAIAFPDDWPSDRPTQVVRRNLLLIGLEALYNAARHARARRITLALAPVAGGDWLLSVVDDGVGLRAAGTDGAGVGLRSMRRRAEEIGAQLEWSRPATGGTAVRLRFSPRARARSGVA